ncbi:MAG: hypothetical protein ABIQ18_39710 [Umezawaea sp.]
MTDKLRELDDNRRALMPWLWTATILAMLTSLGSGTILMVDLGSPIYLAILFPLASDVGLIASLRASAKLSAYGIVSGPARTLRYFSVAFCLALNCTGAVMNGDYAAAGFHAGIPVMVFVLALCEEHYSSAFAALIAEQRKADAQTELVAARDEVTVGAAESAPVAEVVEVVETGPVVARSKRIIRPDEELLPIVHGLIRAQEEGKRVPRRAVQTACNVGPVRATELISAAYSVVESTADDSRAYL